MDTPNAPNTYTVNLDSTKPIHISHTSFGRDAGIGIRQLWYPPDVTNPDPTLPPGTARTKRGLTIPYDDLDEFTQAFLNSAYDISPGELNAAADLIESATDGAMHISTQLRKIANAVMDPDQDEDTEPYPGYPEEDNTDLVDLDDLKALFDS